MAHRTNQSNAKRILEKTYIGHRELEREGEKVSEMERERDTNGCDKSRLLCSGALRNIRYNFSVVVRVLSLYHAQL